MAKRTARQVGISNVRKGKTHERRIAALLTAWSGTEFRRRRVEGRDDATLWINSAADVIPVTHDFPFSIECKSGAGFSIDGLLADPAKCMFTTWWFQSSYDAKLISKLRKRKILPMLFFKPHPNHDWVVIPTSAISLLRPKASAVFNSTLWFPHIIFDEYNRIGKIKGNVSHSPKHKKLVTMTLEPVILCRWREFEAQVDPVPLLLAK